MQQLMLIVGASIFLMCLANASMICPKAQNQSEKSRALQLKNAGVGFQNGIETLFTSKSGYQLSLLSNHQKFSGVNSKVTKIHLFLHGLGDSKEAMLPLANRKSVDSEIFVIPDLLGHGSSYDLNFLHGRQNLTTELQSSLVAEMLLNLAVAYPNVSIEVTGHSYGAGVGIGAMKVLRDLQVDLPVVQLNLLTPYIGRIDRYLMRWGNVLAVAGFGAFRPGWHFFDNWAEVFRKFTPTDSAVLMTLQQNFRGYFLKKGLASAEAERRAKISTEVVRQSESMNWLNANLSFLDMPVSLIGANNDNLVPRQQLVDFFNSARAYGVDIRMDWIHGDHFSPLR